MTSTTTAQVRLTDTLGRASKWMWFAVMWGSLAALGSSAAVDDDHFWPLFIEAEIYLAKRKHKTALAVGLLQRRMAELPPEAPMTAKGSVDRALLANVTEKEIFNPLMALAIDRDHPATVMWLLDNPHACTIGDALIAAAALNSHRVVEALLALSADANVAAPYPSVLLASARTMDPPILDDTFGNLLSVEFDGYTALHAAALRESTASAALLLEHGADANARAEGGWTPLHLSLLQGFWFRQKTLDRPGLAVANLLLAAGADPTAATDLVGWTPLHLAALWAPTVRGAMEDDHEIEPVEAPLAGDARCCGDEGAVALEFVRALLAKGADARAHTRLGVWTPLRTAMNRVETKLDWRDPVLALLRSAGGEDGGYDDALVRWSPPGRAPALNPVFSSSISWSVDAPISDFTFVAPLTPPGFAFAFALPSLDDFGGRAVNGSFTFPDAEERLLFESFEAKPAGHEYAISRSYKLISLEDRHGVVRPITAICSFCDDSYTVFKGVCRDPRINTDVLVFEVGASTNAGGWDGENWFRYDADKGAFVEIVPDECDWNRSAGGAIGSLAVESAESRVQFGLVEAALAGDEGSVVRMLAVGADVNERDARGVTALHLAAWIERPAILALLLNAGADVHAVAVGTLETPLHMAGKARDSGIARALLDAGADVDARQATGATPLHTAAHYDRAETAQVLISAGGSVKAEDHRGATPLHVAASEGAREVTEVLIVAGADLEAVDGAGHTPLYWAVHNGHGVVATALLDAGANVNVPSVAGTPLLVAVNNGMEHVAVILMEHGADADVTNDQGKTAADLAESKDMTEVLVRVIEGRWRELSARRPATDAAMDSQRPLLLETVSKAVFDRLLARAIGRDDSEAVLWLLASPREHAPNNALVTAAAIDSHRVVEALLDLPVDVNASTRYPPKLPASGTATLGGFMMPAVLPFGGYTALHAAAEHESTASAALLLEHGANASARTEGGWTPLHLALLLGVDRPDLEVANLLLAGGADPTAATALFGWTPLHLAAFRAFRPTDAAVERSGAQEFVSALLSQGADAQAHTRLGGWTPLRNEQSPGGAGDDDWPLAPITIYSGDFYSEDGPNERGTEYEVEAYTRETINPLNSANSSDGHGRITSGWPTYSAFGGREVRGSFTSPDSKELLLIEALVLESNDNELYGSYAAVALKDRHGAVLPAIAYDASTQFVGICGDPQTNTDVVMLVIEGWSGGLDLEDWVYLRYDEAEGALVEVERDSHYYNDGEQRDSNGAQELCRWFRSAEKRTGDEDVGR